MPPCCRSRTMYRVAQANPSTHSTSRVADRIVNIGDFLLDRPDRTKRYYEQAHALFEAAESRADEIAARFGEELFPRYDADRRAAFDRAA